MKEVYFVDTNIPSYEGESVFSVYDAKVTTSSQVLDAYKKGADWCGYGWMLGDVRYTIVSKNPYTDFDFSFRL